jgi:hypothetical protein
MLGATGIEGGSVPRHFARSPFRFDTTAWSPWSLRSQFTLIQQNHASETAEQIQRRRESRWVLGVAMLLIVFTLSTTLNT